MRHNRWLTMLALLGVLLHAGLVARHGVASVSRAIGAETQLADFGVICHGDGTQSRLSPEQTPGAPAPDENQSRCPLCLGMAPVAAVLTSELPPLHRPDSAAMRLAVMARIFQVELAAVRPPTRGPPAAA